jgi:hypothetical protein
MQGTLIRVLQYEDSYYFQSTVKLKYLETKITTKLHSQKIKS